MEQTITDAVRVNILERERIALVPKQGGGWWAEVYGDGNSPQWVYEGGTARTAADAAIKAIRERQAAR